jgi:hypothetical protein
MLLTENIFCQQDSGEKKAGAANYNPGENLIEINKLPLSPSIFQYETC